MRMSRPMVLVFMLILLVITSQLEWKQPLINDLDQRPSLVHEEQLHLKRETIKEKVILSQEKEIRQLSELVRKLRSKLQECNGGKIATNGTGSSTSEVSSVVEEQQISQN